MTRSRKYVGLDVHQATTVIAIRDEAGHVAARTVVATEAVALRTVFRGLRGEIHVALEEGTQAQWFRAEMLYVELAVLQELRPQAKAAMLAEAKRDPALRTIPYLGPVRVALQLATLQTPWRFRTKRHLWAYAGLAVVTRTSAEYG